MSLTTANVSACAADLLTDPGDSNPEYDRAIVELTCSLLGIPTDERDFVLTHLHALKQRRSDNN